MKNISYGLFRMGPNPYSFLSGVFISVAVNLFTTDLYPDTIGLKNILPIISGILFFISGIFGILIAWNLDDISRVSITERPAVFNQAQNYEVWKDLIDHRIGRLISFLLCLCIFTIIGIVVLSTPVLNWIETILLSLNTLGGNV